MTEPERWLDAKGIRSKARTGKDGVVVGGKPFSRGALFHLLRNPVNLGLIRHGDTLHDGLHEPILDRDLFDAVQDRLAAHRTRRRCDVGSETSSSPLTGRIFDAAGERMSPTFAIGARGRRYRYYVSASLQQGKRPRKDGILRRVPAGHIEQAITDRIRKIDGHDAREPLSAVERVEVHRDRLILSLRRDLHRAIRAGLLSEEDLHDAPGHEDRIRLTLPLNMPRRGGELSIIPASVPGPKPDPNLVRALRTAHAMLDHDTRGRPLLEASPTSPYRRRLIRLAFLAPALQAAILSGHQPRGLTLARLLEADFPIGWDEQIALFEAARRSG